MELGEGECSEDISNSSGNDEDEKNDNETMETEGNDKEENRAVLTSLEKQLQEYLNDGRSCDDVNKHQSTDDARLSMRRKETEEEEEGEEDRIPNEKLEALGQCKTVRDMLTNPHLRQLLVELDTSPTPQQSLRRAMNIPVFIEFADECLTICGVRDTNKLL